MEKTRHLIVVFVLVAVAAAAVVANVLAQEKEAFVTFKGKKFPALAALGPPPIPADNRQLLDKNGFPRMDDPKVQLGKLLFFDTRLSGDNSVNCAICHVPEMRLENTIFEEPTRRGNGNYYDPVLLEKDHGYDLERPVTFDILEHAQEPRAEAHPEGGATIRAYGDLKRHAMGRHLADPGGPQPPLTPSIAPLLQGGEMVLIKPTEFLTPELWGVGNTGPWMHDGRAGSLEEAILLHGEADPPPAGDPGRSEAQEARDAYLALPFFDHMHRFLPALIRRAGGAVLEVPVNHRPRAAGASHYGLWDRAWAGLIDMLGVAWLQRRMKSPEVEEMDE